MSPFADRLSPALRGLIRHKRFSALAIASLGVAIALNTTMYSVTDALLFPRVAMRLPQNLYHMPFYGDYKQRLSADVRREAVNGLSFFEDMAYRANNFGAANLAERGSLSQTARVINVSPNYFTMLGVTALHGRLLDSSDVNAPTHPVVVSERFWKQMLPDRPMTDTATFSLDGEPRTVIGVLAYESDFPGENTDVWQLPSGNASQRQALAFVFNVVRVKDGVTLDEAYAELGAVAAKLERMAGDGPKNARFDLERLVGGPLHFQNFHLAIIGAVLFVLLVACFNLANLQLARGLGRTRELATRAAVGATRRDLVNLLVMESAWIAGAGLVLGVILTFWGIHIVRSQVPPTLEQYLIRPQISWRLFAFATITSALALSIVGLLPAIRVSRVDVNELLKAGAGTGATRHTRWQAGSLVVFQVGLALALMIGATLLIRASASLYRLDINPLLERVVGATMGARPVGPADPRRMSDVANQALSRAMTIPGIAAAATTRYAMPPHRTISVAQDGALAREIATGLWSYRLVSDGYLKLYGMKVTKGRDFTPNEAGRSVIMDALTASFFWPGQDPIGRQIKFGSDTRHDEGWLTVVGVAEYVNTWSAFRRANQAERLEPQLGAVWVLNTADTARVNAGIDAQGRPRATSFQLYVRGTDKIQRLPLQMRQTLPDLATGLSVGFVDRLQSALQLDVVRKVQDFVAALFTCFALIALGLSALGVYSVVSHTVSQRTREIGVRVALGASERDIRQSVLYQGNVLALTGIALGLPLAYNTTPFLERFTLGEASHDYTMFLLGTVVLFSVTLLATYLPARRAMRINPVEALRAE